MFTIRTTKPKNNPYYNTTGAGGYSYAIKGSPTDPNANVLANCVGYANGRFAEIMAEITGKKGVDFQLVCNAENFIEKAKNYGLQISSTPTLGGIMVWQKGGLGGSDGAGHVAVVERINSDGSIYLSESGWGASKPFWNSTRTNSNGRWGQGSGYKFRGCIVNPAVKEEPKPEPKPGKTVDELAREVLAGKWGNGLDRKNALIKAGYDYYAVQRRVNEILYGSGSDDIKVGDTVTVTEPYIYGTTRKFVLWHKEYKVMELVGNRAVIGVGGRVTSAINVKYLRKA